MAIDAKRLSLMTFPIEFDIATGAITIENTLRLAAEQGIGYIDLMSVRERQIASYKEAMRSTGVKVYCDICSLSFMSGKDQLAQNLDRELWMARDIGASQFMIVPYVMGELRKAEQMGRARTQDLLVTGFQEAVQMGAQYEIPVCYETTPHDELCLSGNEDCKYILDQVPGLRLILDTANMLPHGDETMAAYAMLKDYIVHVHLKDVRAVKKGLLDIGAERMKDGRVMKSCVWGEGIIPVRQLYEQMIADGYQGMFALEYVRPQGLRCGMDQHRAQLSQFLAENV